MKVIDLKVNTVSAETVISSLHGVWRPRHAAHHLQQQHGTAAAFSLSPPVLPAAARSVHHPLCRRPCG